MNTKLTGFKKYFPLCDLDLDAMTLILNHDLDVV